MNYDLIELECWKVNRREGKEQRNNAITKLLFYSALNFKY